MSSAIGSVGQLVSVIRSELSGRAAARPGRRARASDAPGARYADANLAGLIELRVKQIARDDPQRGRKAFRVFLEAVLLSQLGERMLADPRFYQTLDDVQQAMESDPACSKLIGDAIEHLLASN